ncbi:hypothetical protein PENARI_c049G09032 [Penicillium arizonense]|uniref:HTH OST-type domain-containing protein n=1 Tax=Penicillium arizonense TaxID=1835702 RepID=A0A1F5L2A3_PENAI|nr:hypothetical protein PENARI_c049G09032 [Penicillium arizonense]OGE47334.1 hypothetical protein PENARI_c049G09032 [Penicillium arizonense]
MTTTTRISLFYTRMQPWLAIPLLNLWFLLTLKTRNFAEIAKYGTAHVKRAFGDWTDHRLDGWSNELLNQPIQPIQQNAYTHGKNTTDSAMIINAMDLLHSNCVDGFCLVSSDSDFTPLATRLRESGLMVFGFGERKTPKAFVAACDKFIYTEDLVYPSGLAPHSDRAEVPQSHNSVQQAKEDSHPAIRQQNTTENSLDNSGWARLSDVGKHLTTQHPEFNIFTQGYSKLSKLFSDSPNSDIEHRLSQADKPPELYGDPAFQRDNLGPVFQRDNLHSSVTATWHDHLVAYRYLQR